jgi:hypothetical protein
VKSSQWPGAPISSTPARASSSQAALVIDLKGHDWRASQFSFAFVNSENLEWLSRG